MCDKIKCNITLRRNNDDGRLILWILTKEKIEMVIDFFQENEGLKTDAIKGGVYLIELLKEGKEQSIHLYVGESGAMVKRCGEHLYTLFDKPEYLGLDMKDLQRNDLILKISAVEIIKERKKFWRDKNYKEKELDVIKKFKPITQSKTSDRQIENKMEIVQDKMRELGFK